METATPTTIDAVRAGWRSATDGIQALAQGSFNPAPWLGPLYTAAAGMAPPRLGPTPFDVVYERGPVRLRRYAASERRFRTPILFVYSLINRATILDFLPGRSLVEFVTGAGFDAYVIDWGTPGPAEHALGWDDYLNDHLRSSLRTALRLSESASATLYGYCMGGTMALAYAALRPAGVSALVAQATPVDFQAPGTFHRMTRPGHFPVDGIIDAMGNMPVAMMEAGFTSLAPLQRAAKWVDACRLLDSPADLEAFVAMETWAADNVPFAGETYRQYIRDCYQTNAFFTGRMVVGGRAVRLSSIGMPTLAVTADRDEIVPAASSHALLDVVSATDKALLRFPTGHIGLVTSSKARTAFWPAITEWIAKRSERVD